MDDISNFQYGKIRNLMMGFLGVLSPMIPLVFLFRKDLVESIDIIPLMIIIIVVNCLLFVHLLTLNMLRRSSELSIKRYDIQKNLNKIEYLHSKLNLLFEKDNTKKDKLIKKNRKNEKLIAKCKLKIKKYEEFIADKTEEEQKRDDYIITVTMNNVIGAILVFIKSLTYLDYKYTFKNAIFLMIVIYGSIFILGIFYDVVAFIYKKNSEFNEYRKNKIDKKITAMKKECELSA